ncbi:hypothetical protein F0A16_02655 [Salinicola corii]|uniref:DUF4148 domain-containing protein n=1 Tax=Salinicola corii TaxID=2606937 RepID=A0A640WJJ6_9GAMM|nr:hypothetical protein [Salinicola corii]KAA0020711.1 hypothetical protein F0A16_02655 [Salinicola corii]
MKTPILAAIVLAVALPAAAQANSAQAEEAFASQQQALNVQQTSEFQALPTQYRIDPVNGGHSDAADEALTYVSASTMRATSIPAGNDDLIGGGQSVAAAQALQSVGQSTGHGSVEMTFASID